MAEYLTMFFATANKITWIKIKQRAYFEQNKASETFASEAFKVR